MKLFSIILSMLLLVACETDMADDVQDDPTIDEEEESQSEQHEENGHDDSEEAERSLEGVSTDSWEVDVLAENLEIPWNINIAGDQIFIPERGGAVALIENGEVERQEVSTSHDIAHQGEGGLLGMALTDDFESSQEAFLYYTYEDEQGILANKVVTARYGDGQWQEEDILLDEIPGDRIHNGGRIEIGLDGYLYVTTGDANDPNLSQDLDNLAGKILRMTTSGDIPEDNPFDDSYIYSYGHRNPQGLSWNGEGILYSSEHGPTGHDEINIIEPGNNYGWPEIFGDEQAEGMEAPIVHSGSDTWAPSGITFFGDHLLIAGLRGQALYWWNEGEDQIVPVFEGEGRLRDVISHDNALYVITNNTDGRGQPSETDDRLLKLTLHQ